MPVWLWNTIFLIMALVTLIATPILIMDVSQSKDEDDKDYTKRKPKAICKALISGIIFAASFVCVFFGFAQVHRFTPTRYTVTDTSPIYYIESEGTRLDGYIKTGDDDNGNPELTPFYSEETYKHYYYVEPVTHKRHDLTLDGNMAIAIGTEGDTEPHIEFRRNWCGPVYVRETVLVTPIGNYNIAKGED